MKKIYKLLSTLLVFCIITSVQTCKMPFSAFAEIFDSNDTSAVLQNDDIKCDVTLLYDDTYSERVIVHNKKLTVNVKVTNNDRTDKNIVCIIAEYDENGVFQNLTHSLAAAADANGFTETQVTRIFPVETNTAKIFIWSLKSLQPLTEVITLNENESDYYANTALQAQEYNIGYEIKGKINTAGDIDYIKFSPEAAGEYVFNCIGTANTATTLYDKNQTALISQLSRYKYSLNANQTYYVKISGDIGKYVLSIQNNVPNEADNFDVYKFDVDTNIYKKSIRETCESLYYSNKSLSKQMYNEYEDILGDDAKLHRLPDFLWSIRKI